MKVGFFSVQKYDKTFIPSSSDNLELTFFEEALDDTTIEQALGFDAISLFVHDHIMEASSISRLAEMGVKFIALRSAGYNNINRDACKEHHIRVVCVPSYSPISVAEFAVALVFDLSRKMTRKAMDIKYNSDFSLSETFIGYEVRDRTLAVIGTGNIGKNFAEIMQKIGLKVKAYDVFPDEAWSATHQIPYCSSLQATVKDADIVSLHCPSLPSTYHLLNEQVLMHDIGKPILLINTSRGDLIDNEALLKALHSGKVMAAGLDVIEGEVELLKGNITENVKAIIEHPNVIFTPHMAYFTREALLEIWTTSIKNLEKFANNQDIDPLYIRA